MGDPFGAREQVRFELLLDFADDLWILSVAMAAVCVLALGNTVVCTVRGWKPPPLASRTLLIAMLSLLAVTEFYCRALSLE